MIRVGVVGTSWWADSMYLPALADHPAGRCVAVCGRNEATAAELAERWNVPLVFTDWREMIASGEIDAVIVASANDTHVPVTRAAVEAGLAVLCEKPVALTAAEADEVAHMADAADAITMVPFTYQYMPMFAATKALIEDGFLGIPHHLNLRYFTEFAFDPTYSWRFDKEIAGSGVIGDLGSHWLFYAEWLFGPIAELGCLTASFVERERRPDGSDYDQTEDSCIMQVRFASGALGTLQTCAVSWEGTPFGQTHHLDAHGTGGTIYGFSDWDTVQEVRVLERGATGPAQPIDLPARFPDLRFDTVHNTYRDVFRRTDAMTRQWIHDVASDRPSTPDLVDGARVQHLIEVALASADDGGRLLPVRPPRP
ncbi:MAG: Gfo/Idh/MocA family oxidoreductase [Actinomycetota bacterium]